MALGKPLEAAAEFQKILDRPGLLFADPVGPRARLELGRALAIAGERAKAKAAYQGFLSLWKDANPDIPIRKQAKTEYAELQRFVSFPMREDVKRKKLPCFPVRGSCLACIQPDVGDWACPGQLRLYLVGFMFPMVVRRRRLVKLRKQKCWLQTTCQP